MESIVVSKTTDFGSYPNGPVLYNKIFRLPGLAVVTAGSQPADESSTLSGGIRLLRLIRLGRGPFKAEMPDRSR